MFINTSCNKKNDAAQSPVEPPVNYSNINLLNKSPEVIKNAINGNWQQVLDSTFGWQGWSVNYPQYNRSVTFLKNDTLKIENNSVVTLYEKGEYVWGLSSHTADSVFTFIIPGKINWVMDKIFNDTLKIDAFPHYMYFIKKP